MNSKKFQRTTFFYIFQNKFFTFPFSEKSMPMILFKKDDSLVQLFPTYRSQPTGELPRVFWWVTEQLRFAAKMYILVRILKNITVKIFYICNNQKIYQFKLKLRDKTVYFSNSLSVLCFDLVLRYASSRAVIIIRFKLTSFNPIDIDIFNLYVYQLVFLFICPPAYK